jgi:hypothetical protein
VWSSGGMIDVACEELFLIVSRDQADRVILASALAAEMEQGKGACQGLRLLQSLDGAGSAVRALPPS